MGGVPSARATNTALGHHIALRITPLHGTLRRSCRRGLLRCGRFLHGLFLGCRLRVMQHGRRAHTRPHMRTTANRGGDTDARITRNLPPLVHPHTNTHRANTRAHPGRDTTCSHADADTKWPHRHAHPDTCRSRAPCQQAASHQSQKQCFHACHCPSLAFPAQMTGTSTRSHLHKK